MPERPNQKDHDDQKIHFHRIKDQSHDHKNQPRTLVVPPLGQQNHIEWKHTQIVRPQERPNDHVIAPQIDPRRLNLNPGNLRQRQAEPFQFQHHHHHQHYHNRHFQNPYDGMNNYWRDSWQDNYYYDRHRHHRDKDDFIPHMLEGILGGILSGSLVRELDKLNVDGKSSYQSYEPDESEDFDDSDRLDRAIREDKSPDRQISINLDFSPQGQTSGLQARFERTG